MWNLFTRKEKTFDIYLTNTLRGKKELFQSIGIRTVKMYSCGPTVYGPQHIGNLRSALFSDTIARILKDAGYLVNRVTNITDVGHMVGDGDTGEDKMAVGAKNEGVTPEQVAKRYTTRYLADIALLNVDTNDIQFPHATEYIDEQIEMISILEKKGHVYKASDGMYFDTATYPAYGMLGKRNEVETAHARIALADGKKNPQDFVLWRNAKPNDLQQWDSPWGRGNPGWSIECSAMIRALLGDTIDIHTGGEDHISIHHNNEIAQSQGVSGEPLARIWMHHAFLTLGGQKISKSLMNTFTLDDVKSHHIHPLALRYFFLQAHYKSPLNFTWEALQGAEVALKRLWNLARTVHTRSKGVRKESEHSAKIRAFCHDDIATASALAYLWNVIQDEKVQPEEQEDALATAEALFGLSLNDTALGEPELQYVDTNFDTFPVDLVTDAKKRREARNQGHYDVSDALRVHIENSGYAVEDTGKTTTYTKR